MTLLIIVKLKHFDSPLPLLKERKLFMGVYNFLEDTMSLWGFENSYKTP